MGGIFSAHLRFFFFFFFHLLLTLGKKIDNMKPCDIIFPFIIYCGKIMSHGRELSVHINLFAMCQQ